MAAKEEAAAEQATSLDRNFALVYGLTSGAAVQRNAQWEWLSQRGFESPPPDKDKLIAVNPPKWKDNFTAVNHRVTSRDYNHDGQAFINFPGFSHLTAVK